MINFNSDGTYAIHRLVQEVQRINIENDPNKFEIIVKETQSLFNYHGKNLDDTHYLHFLLYMSEREEIKSILYFDSVKRFLDKLADKEIKHWLYFLDLAYEKFSKKRYFEFLGDSLACCSKEGFVLLITGVLRYIQNGLVTGKFSQADIYMVFKRFDFSKENTYKLTCYSQNLEKKQLQRSAAEILFYEKQAIFGSFGDYVICGLNLKRRKRRSLCRDMETPKEFDQIKSKVTRSHMEKVSLMTHWVSSGLMTKNILSAIIRGDLQDVAVNFELIASSEILGKISNHLLSQGKNLEAEADLLEKNLGLENKKVWSLLVDKEVSFIGKKLFLGKSLQVASSFVSRGTGIYFAYNLGKQLEAYEEGDTELLPEIVSNGVITGITVGEISIESLEYLKYITRIAGRVNPYLEAVSVLVWLGTEIYESEEQIQIIQKHVNLSLKEWYVEFWRGFFHYPTSNYLQAKAKNAQLVEHAVDFLKNHTDFRSYIFPIFSLELALFENNTVLLDHQRTLTLGIEVPDVSVEGDLFCLSGIPKTNNNNPFTYLCHHAMGVEYNVNRSAEINLINLGTGNDTVFGLPDFPNYFFVQNGEKIYRGGDAGNIFRLEGNATISGNLIGGNKSDALLLEQFSPRESAYLLIDPESYLCGKQELLEEFDPLPCRNKRIRLSLINQIYGRNQQQDVVYMNSDIHFMDGRGSYAAEYPDVFFLNEHSHSHPSVMLRNNTLVLFSINTSVKRIDYRIPKNEMGQAEIRTSFNAAVQHRFFFDCVLDDILEMNVQNDTLTLSVLAENDQEEIESFTIKLFDPSFFNLNHSHGNITNFEKNSAYFFQNMEIKLVNNQQLFAQELITTNESLEESIKRYAELAKYLDKTFTLKLQSNVTLAIGRGEHEIFYADGLFPTHLVGNGGENLYLIIPPSDGSFPLADITLYANPSAELDSIEQTDTLDLRKVYKKLKKICPNAEFYLNLVVEEEDLILTLSSNYIDLNQCNKESYGRVLTVCLKSGIDWYQTLDILLEDTIPKNIVRIDDEDWMLIDSPLTFTEHKQIIVLTEKDFGENPEIALLRNSGNYSFFRNDSDLILTNIHADPLGACTLVAHDYYCNPGMKQKLLSAKLDFLDEDFYLKDHQPLMDEAQNFSDFVEQLKKPASERKHFPLLIPIRSKELPKLRLKRQIPTAIKFRLAPESKGWLPLFGFGLSATFMMVLGGFYCLYKRDRAAVISLALMASLPNTHAQSTKETQLDFSSGFSIENDCLTSMTPLGWLAVCENNTSIVFLKNNQKSCSFYFESYQMNNTFLQRVGDGVWEANLCETTHNALAEEIYPLLPKHWQEEFMELRTQDQAWSNWKYHAGMTVTSMVGDGLVLHTPVGNVFKQLGLAPDWQSREHRYLLSRCGLALEQPLFHLSLAPSSLSLGLISMELALLHPASHRAYRYLSQQGGDVAKAKFALRLLADILQLGVNQIGHVAHVLEYCFPTSELVKNISLGLRMCNYFYFLTGDLSYWHLGLALFLLPQIPQLLDHIGIPASRGVQRMCQQLANVLLGQTLLQRLSEDEERQVQADRELSRADARVMQARQRLSSTATASSRFFMTHRSADSCSANDENQEKPMALTFFK